MTPPIFSNIITTSPSLSYYPSPAATEGQDENKYQVLSSNISSSSDCHWISSPPVVPQSYTREKAQQQSALTDKNTPQKQEEKSGLSTASLLGHHHNNNINSNNRGPSVTPSSESAAAVAAGGNTDPIRKDSVSPVSGSNYSRSTAASTAMREPVAVSPVMETRHALTPRKNNDPNAHLILEAREAEQTRFRGQPPMAGLAEPDRAMTATTARGRVSTDGFTTEIIRQQQQQQQQHQPPSSTATPPPRHINQNSPVVGDVSSEQMKRTAEKTSVRSASPSAAVAQRNHRGDGNIASASPKYLVGTTPSNRSVPVKDNHSVHSQTSSSVPLHPSSSDWPWGRSEPDDQEQALFEQRLCEDAYGVAVRKINQNGKSNLRYVKCCTVDASELEGDGTGASSTKSVSSRSRGAFSRLRGDRDRSLDRSETRDPEAHRNLIAKGKKRRVLTWGKKKDVRLPLEKFTVVRMGKTTDRTRRNASPASRILSLITDDPQHPSLDIEAPTRVDRDKFARAFSRFLDVPLEGDDIHSVRSSDVNSLNRRESQQSVTGKSLSRDRMSVAHSASDTQGMSSRVGNSSKSGIEKLSAPLPVVTTLPPSEAVSNNLKNTVGSPQNNNNNNDSDKAKSSTLNLVQVATASQFQKDNATSKATSGAAYISSTQNSHPSNMQSISPKEVTKKPSYNRSATEQSTERSHAFVSTEKRQEGDDGSVVSSLTGAGFDQEIVEELHQALNELRLELEESRTEAARAVKVAEQAIQSAEKSNSKDWNSTVTHKAAEAAAMAQKKSAEAMAKQRLAEERLEGERRNAAFWRKQAESAEEEAGAFQTRAAAAEVQRAAMAECLESERQKATLLVESIKQRFASSEVHQREALDAAMGRNRALELELDNVRRNLAEKNELAKSLREALSEANCGQQEVVKSVGRKKLGLIGRMKKTNNVLDGGDPAASRTLLSNDSISSSSHMAPLEQRENFSTESLAAEDILKVYAEVKSVRTQFELLKKATADDLRALPADAELWACQASQAVQASQDENRKLRQRLALETAMRRKLLHEVQDLRGAVRVYCRPIMGATPSTLSISSQEIMLLHRDPNRSKPDGTPRSSPLSFEFDGIFGSDLGQQDVYNELEEVCLGVLDGYNICLMMFGQTGSGKTHTVLGDVSYSQSSSRDMITRIDNHGIQLLAAKQIFSVATHRSERYNDKITLTIVEIHEERLCDLVAGTKYAEEHGRPSVDEGRISSSRRSNKGKRSDPDEGSASHAATSVSSRPTKLEIKTNHDGETIVHGLVSVDVASFEDVCRVWEESLSNRASRLNGIGADISDYEAASHVIATIKVTSTNISTGVESCGRIQFVDLGGSDVVPLGNGIKKLSTYDSVMSGVGNNNEWKYSNKALSTLSDVVHARTQFVRNVPYRNSTLTHLLSDSLEADTKVVFLACVNSDPKDLQNTACTLRFASKIRGMIVGKATKHTLMHA